MYGKKKNAYRILVGNPGHRWEDNIKMEIREEIGCGGMPGFTWLRVWTSKHSNELSGFIRCWNILL
jgi:hypothetical protein